jgi:hypothetical protein
MEMSEFMDSSLNEYFKIERTRVFDPDALFAQRVIARLAEAPPKKEFWETILTLRRPAFGLAAVLLGMLAAIQHFTPVEPTQGLVAAYFDAESSPAESLLFAESDGASNAILEKAILLDDE